MTTAAATAPVRRTVPCEECGNKFQSSYQTIVVCDPCIQRILEEGENAITRERIEPEDSLDLMSTDSHSLSKVCSQNQHKQER